jgi:hypothetical protein
MDADKGDKDRENSRRYKVPGLKSVQQIDIRRLHRLRRFRFEAEKVDEVTAP